MLLVDNISHDFHVQNGTVVRALHDINMTIGGGRFVSIIGQSGCGKSTLFNIVAGLLLPTQGRIFDNGADITGQVGLVSYMLQKDLLLPWRTVARNITLGLELHGVRRGEAYDRALSLIQKYGLGGFEDQYPSALSGGMRQRAALLRTLLSDRPVILLDEPFAALDAQTRFQMQQWLLSLWKDFNRTVLFVTHDVDEAVYLSDEIYVLSARPGRVADHFMVDLPRPRDRSVISSPDFQLLKDRCLDALFKPALDVA